LRRFGKRWKGARNEPGLIGGMDMIKIGNKKTVKVKGKSKATEKAAPADTRQGALKFGSRFCICPKCGFKTEHERGLPCSSIKCPRCGVFMHGEHCV